MKRIIAAVMALVLCLSLCACGKAHSIGEAVQVDNFAYTIKEVQLVDSVYHGDKSSDDFLTPTGTGENQFSAPGGSTLLWFSAEYTYTGTDTEDSDMAKEFFVPIVKCKGGRFDTNYMVVVKAPDGNWYNLNSDLSWETRENAGLDINSLSFDLEPDSSKTYEVRGFIYIPTDAAENENSKINLYMHTTKFSVR